MTYPAVSSTAERWWESLPHYLQAADTVEPSGGGYPLLRWMSTFADQFDLIDQLVRRLTPALNGGHCDLFEPARAEVAWLTWIAAQVGLSVDGLGPAAARAVIDDNAETRRTGGTLPPIIAAVAAELTGAQVVRTASSEWRLTLTTRPSETPNPTAVAAALAGLAPAWLLLTHQVATGPWLDLSTDWPGASGTWADYGSTGTSGTAAVYGTFEYGEAVYGAGGAAGLWSYFGSWEP